MDWSWVRSHSSFINHSYSQILSYDTHRMHDHPIEWISEKEDSSIQMIHTKRMNSSQYGFVSIGHNSLTNICCLLDYIHLHWMKIEKGDLINQSSLSVLLFIINSFDSTVLLSPYPLRAAISRVMDWSRFKSHSSFINHLYSQTLLNDSNGLHTDPTEWKWEKEDPSIQMIHTKRMNNIQYGFVSIDHNSLSNICFLLYPPYPILNYLFQW